MGLLDAMDSDQFRLGLGLLAAGGARSDGMGAGGRIQEAFSGLDAYKRQREVLQYEKLRNAQERQAVLDRQAAIEQKRTDDDAIRRALSPIQGGQAMTDGRGPTIANAGNLGQMPQFNPRQFFTDHPQASMGALKQAMELNQAFNPAAKYETVAPGASVYKIGANGPELAMTAPDRPEKPDKGPSAVQEYNFAKEQGYGGSFLDFQLAQKRAGASTSNVSINTGQKGFDNTLKLRSDFRSEPIYKAHQDVQSAYSQIQQGLKMASPAGDLAGATKIMKLLDPGSVVRESELGMAMAATGAMDKLLNYSDRVIKGTKLTPNQRADFQKLADALYTESGKQYNSKRGEYQGIAERNGLSVPDVLGAGFKEVKPSKTIVKTGTYGGRKVNQYDDGSTDYAN